MSHEVITCTCGQAEPLGCPVPGHGVVPLTIDPWTLVEAGEAAIVELQRAQAALIAARAAWVSRGLPGDNPFPVGLDVETMRLVATIENMRRWTAGARKVAERRTASANGGDAS